MKGRVPDADAVVVRNATSMGAVCLGKTHMSELAFSGLGLNPITGTPPCIDDEEAVPGGSSSGAGASVAWGLGGLWDWVGYRRVGAYPVGVEQSGGSENHCGPGQP